VHQLPNLTGSRGKTGGLQIPDHRSGEQNEHRSCKLDHGLFLSAGKAAGERIAGFERALIVT
jgi:hypothetical protein